MRDFRIQFVLRAECLRFARPSCGNSDKIDARLRLGRPASACRRRFTWLVLRRCSGRPGERHTRRSLDRFTATYVIRKRTTAHWRAAPPSIYRAKVTVSVLWRWSRKHEACRCNGSRHGLQLSHDCGEAMRVKYSTKKLAVNARIQTDASQVMLLEIFQFRRKWTDCW